MSWLVLSYSLSAASRSSPRPHVDRLACAWLIRHFIDPDATIRYGDVPESDEVAFDMPDVVFGHQGDRCSFETILQAFGLDDPELRTLYVGYLKRGILGGS